MRLTRWRLRRLLGEVRRPEAPMLKYQSPDSTMTLREALGELRAAEGDISHEVSQPLAEALVAHDVVHIIFGLHISDLDEIVAHGWMAFGTTLTFARMHDVTRDRDHQRYSAGFAHGRKDLLVLRVLPHLVAALFRSRQMTKRWPWDSYAEYLDIPLNRIRQEFGIVVSKRVVDTKRPRGPHHTPVVVRS